MAQENEGGPAARQPAPGSSQADITRGSIILSTFNDALENQDVPPQFKGQLLRCLYNNPVRAISVAAGRILAETEQLDPNDRISIYLAATRVCNVQPVNNGGGAPETDAPASSGPTDNSGR
jgi:hypothetical protein